MGKEEDIFRVTYNGVIDESAEDLYENAPCGYLSTLPDGTFLKVNKTFLDWVGYKREELLHQKKIQDLLPIGGKLYYETHYAPLLRMQGFVNEINFAFKDKEGQQLPALVNTVQVKGDDGNPLLNRSTVFNITDRKKYEQELLRAKKEAEEAAKVKAEFLSTVSHEIRTPMNAIISIANLLQEMDHTQEQKEYFRILKLSADNLLHLINDILDHSKIEAGKVTLSEKNLSLRELVYSLLYSVNVKAEEKSLEIKVDIDERLPAFVMGDPVKISQVLTNLLSNAIKFTDKGHVALRLQVQELDEKVVSVDFYVQDTGIGIPQDRLEKVFEEFTQANYEINLKYGGTGLGLTISQKLLALYGSKLSVESEEGKGTQFFFNLRLKLGKEVPSQPEEIAASQETAIKGVRLLLVEDNPVNVLVVSKYLRKWGINFDVAVNGVDAVEKVKQENYELVLMDLQMPEMDGYQATSTIRSLAGDKYKRLPVIALSASARYDYKARIEAAGIQDFISKPFNAKELFDKIAFYSHRSEQEPLATAEPAKATVHKISTPGAPVLTLDTLLEMLDGNEKDLEELVIMTIRNFKSYKIEFQDALNAFDLKNYRFHHHKIKMTLELMQAVRLQTAIERGRKFLEDGTKNKQEQEEIRSAINQELETVLLTLKEILSSRWHH
ncbi:ATP-binding protein [Pontibacter sp. 13R65]|uniref:PAS domain-containing hybrid sensor histidine kinase/response regulator n=1 Tax=Pontibacter sp. 13R65 TaxID=3127458 RepID=UPI00301D05AA